MLTRHKSKDIAIKIVKGLGGKKDLQQWCKDNDLSMSELEEFLNNSTKYAIAANAKEKKKKRWRK